MDRRGFLKHVVATAAVGAVAPKLLAEESVVMGVDIAAAGAELSVLTTTGPAVYNTAWLWYDLNRKKWVEIKSFSVDMDVSLGEDSPAMMLRANHGHSFTPAAQPQAQGNTP